MPTMIFPSDEKLIMKWDRQALEDQIGSKLTPQDDQKTLVRTVTMSDTFRKPVRFTAKLNNGTWELFIHKIGDRTYLPES